MHSIYFVIDTIPDLTISKYSFLDEGGVGGVLKKTNTFLRQMHRQGLLSKIFCHILYLYDPQSPAGHRMKVFFIASGQDKNSLLYTRKLIQNSALSAFYNFRYIGSEPIVDHVQSTLVSPLKQQEYQYGAILVKRVFPAEPSVIRPDDQDVKFNRVAEWKMNENARLYNLFQLMHGLSKPAAFLVDLFPVDYAAALRKVLPIQELRNRTSMRSSMGGSGISFQRDENAEETLRQYENIIKKYESSPHFRANILAFADEQDIIAKLLVDAAGAEALESGNYQIETLDTPTSNKSHHIFAYMNTTAKGAWLDKLELGNLAFLPTLFLLEEVRPFFCFPVLYDGETIEIPKETAPNMDRAGLYLGKDENGHQVSIETKLLKKHAFIAGVPGSGKTNTMLHLATTFLESNVPFLILEPAKKEYRALARIGNIKGIEKLRIFSPSSATLFPLHINPFEFPMGMPLTEHMRNLMAVFEGAFQLDGSTPILIANAMEAIYRVKGWRPNTKNSNNNKLKYPTLSEFYQQISAELELTKYADEIKNNLQTFIQLRIGSLLSREMGELFDVSESTLKPEDWLVTPALIELEAMGSGPANFLTLLLCTLIREALKVAPKYEDEKPRHVIFLEEAHNLIGPEAIEVTGANASPKLAATAYIVKMLAEVRALHEGIIIADQLPSKMAPEVIKNTGIKIAHRLTAADDRSLLGSTMNANQIQLEQMATYGTGETLVATEKILRPYKVKIHKWQPNDNKYISPTDDELFEILADLENLETPKNQAYDDQLERSMKICYGKCIKEVEPLMRKKRELFDAYSYNLHRVKIEAKKLGDEGLADNTKTEKKLDVRLANLLSSMADLFYRVKDCFDQNRIYNRNFGRLLGALRKHWLQLYNRTQTWEPEIAKKHKDNVEKIVNCESFE